MVVRPYLAVMLGLAVIVWPLRARAAGDVSVKQVGGELRIKGDAKANKISLVNEGDVVVGSFDPAGTINGGPGLFFAHGVESIAIDMGAGDDYVTLVDIFFTVGKLPGDLTIATGSGNDTINTEDSSARALKVVTGEGDDSILWDGGGCESWSVRTGPGADQIWISGFGVNGTATVETGAGPDLVSTFIQTFGYASFDGGSGLDELDADESTFNGGLTVENFEN